MIKGTKKGGKNISNGNSIAYPIAYFTKIATFFKHEEQLQRNH